MYRTVSLSSALVLLAAVAGLPGGEKDDPPPGVQAVEKALKQAIKSAEPSIACILVSRDKKAYQPFETPPSADEPGKLGGFPESAKNKAELDLADPDYVPETYGSGVVISGRDRLILTNYHVVRDAVKIYVRVPQLGKDGKLVAKGSYANIHAADPRSDLAVLQLLDQTITLTEIRLGDASSVAEGQFVVAMACPFASAFRDIAPSASWGVVSDIRRPVLKAPGGKDLIELERSKFTLTQFGRLIEIDARQSLGSSGGALINLKGEMIGITNAAAGLTTVETPGGFALPMDDNVRAIIDKLKRGEEAEYGFLGVSLSKGGGLADRYLIEHVIPNSPAAKAKLRPGMSILSFNGVPIRDSNELFFNINVVTAGTTVKIEYTEEPQRTVVKTTEATLAKSYVVGPVIASARADAAKCGGLRVDYTSVLLQALGDRKSAFTGEYPNGVVIRDVTPQSPADKALLQPDKIVTHVNGKAVNFPKEFYAAMDKARESGKHAELEVMNLGDRDTYTVKLDLP